MKISSLTAREILDSRGIPTLEARVATAEGVEVRASVPSGTSTGKFEAHEARDGDERYDGLGVRNACRAVNTVLQKAVKGIEATDFAKVEQAIRACDTTKQKTKIGANAMLAASMACARLGAAVSQEPLWRYLRKVSGLRLKAMTLPLPFMNIFNGGRHADTNLDFQEFMIVPRIGTTMRERVEAGARIFKHLGEVLREFGYDADTGMEGGYAPNMTSSVQALELISIAIQRSGFKIGRDVAFALDVGASELYDEHLGGYVFQLDHSFLEGEHLLSLFEHWVERFPIIAIEDPFDQEDVRLWQKAAVAFKKNASLLLVGDDLFATNLERLKMLAPKRVANAAIVKPNQIGTLSETFAFVAWARSKRMKLIASHRSGETSDDWIADLAVAIGAYAIKAGSVQRGERVAKWNRLMAIEEEIRLE